VKNSPNFLGLSRPLSQTSPPHTPSLSAPTPFRSNPSGMSGYGHKFQRTTDRKWPTGNPAVKWPMTTCDHERSSRDPNTRHRVQYRENSWRCHLATSIAIGRPERTPTCLLCVLSSIEVASERPVGLRRRSSSAAFCHIEDVHCEANLQQLRRQVFCSCRSEAVEQPPKWTATSWH